jgi:NTE family protein
MRIGLVLGAGGVWGGSWLAGALQGLAQELGWDPQHAERIVGTSAGAMVGGLLAAGVSPAYLAAHCSGEELGGLSAALSRAEASRCDGATIRAQWSGGAIAPGSWRLALSSLARPHRYAPATVLAGWLPRGPVSTDALEEAIRTAAGDGWAAHPGFRAVACDYATGRRLALGAGDAPLGRAVAASCAIPGFYRPVTLGGRSLVDGAIRSPSNLDLLAGRGLDLVICLSPMSSPDAPPARTLGERAAAAVRQHAGRRLRDEARAVRASGTETMLVEPTAADLAAAGDGARSDVVRTAAERMRRVLHESGLAERVAPLSGRGGPSPWARACRAA